MTHADYRSKIDVEDAKDTDVRKQLFRQMSRDLVQCMKEGFVTDRAGAIARMMEHAFKAGLELGQSDPDATASDRYERSFTENDVPALTQRFMRLIKSSIFNGPTIVVGSTKVPRALNFVARQLPRDPRFPTTISRDEWILITASETRYSDKVFRPLIKLGLFVEHTPLDGNRTVLLSEWGYELFKTGKTATVDDRKQGASSTYPEYWGILDAAVKSANSQQ